MYYYSRHLEGIQDNEIYVLSQTKRNIWVYKFQNKIYIYSYSENGLLIALWVNWVNYNNLLHLTESNSFVTYGPISVRNSAVGC
jgi:hypothetical protein